MPTQPSINFVEQLYQATLFRAANTGEIAYWANQIDTGVSTEAQVAADFALSPEVESMVLPIARLYDLVGRTPDAGIQGWMTLSEIPGEPYSNIVTGFVDSFEFQAKYGDEGSPVAFVTDLYQNLLHRAPDAAGLQFWTSDFSPSISSFVSEANVVTGIVTSAEFIADATPAAQAWLNQVAQDVVIGQSQGGGGGLSGGSSAFTLVAGGGVDVTGGLLPPGENQFTAAIDTVTSNPGGVAFVLGQGGGWNPTLKGYDVGSETIDLSASTGVADTLVVGENGVTGTIAVFNGTAGGVTGFQMVAGPAADMLTFADLKTVLADFVNPANATVATAIGAAGLTAASVLDPTGSLTADLANLTYSVHNGVITFDATAGHATGSFTQSELIDASELIENYTAGGGTDKVAVFVSNSNAFVVASGHAAVGITAAANSSSVVELIGVGAVSGFSSTGGPTLIGATDVSLASTPNPGGAQTFTVTGHLAGATTSGGFAVVQVSAHVGDTLVFNNAPTEAWAGGSAAVSQVNVSSAVSVAAALDLAANNAAVPAATGLYDWFQWGGNTYIVEAINNGAASAIHPALAAADAVVELAGLVNLNSASATGHSIII